MKTLRYAIFAFGLLLVVSGVKAQTTHVVGRVPFDFVVGKQVLPAGEYTIQSVDRIDDALTIRSNEESINQVTITRSAEKLQPAAKTVLVFHRLGNQYFLSEIWVEGHVRGRMIPQSPIETQMAENVKDSEVVMVAALATR